MVVLLIWVIIIKKNCTLTYVNRDKRLFIHSFIFLSSWYCLLLKQNTSTVVFTIYQYCSIYNIPSYSVPFFFLSRLPGEHVSIPPMINSQLLFYENVITLKCTPFFSFFPGNMTPYHSRVNISPWVLNKLPAMCIDISKLLKFN